MALATPSVAGGGPEAVSVSLVPLTRMMGSVGVVTSSSVSRAADAGRAYITSNRAKPAAMQIFFPHILHSPPRRRRTERLRCIFSIPANRVFADTREFIWTGGRRQHKLGRSGALF